MPKRDDYWTHNPISAKGGLRLEEYSLEQYWAERWLSALDAFSIGHRQVRGKRYAVEGQVLELIIEKGAVYALVQGSTKDPYRIEMGLHTLTKEQWKGVLDRLKNDLGVVSKILSGSMPYSLEYVFRSAGVSLFPRNERDLQTSCSCADLANPCKHISAVHYLLAQEFARDPFLMLKLRGLVKEEFLEELGLGALGMDEAEQGGEEERLAVATFWAGSQEPLPELPAQEGPLTTHLALIKQLGPFPMWRGHTNLIRELKGVYSAAQAKAVSLLADHE